MALVAGCQGAAINVTDSENSLQNKKWGGHWWRYGDDSDDEEEEDEGEEEGGEGDDNVSNDVEDDVDDTENSGAISQFNLGLLLSSFVLVYGIT